MHVVATGDTRSLIIGRRDLELDGLTGLQEISHRAGGTVWLYEGGRRLRPATAAERCTLPVSAGRPAVAADVIPSSERRRP
jgi:hypothetical protein